MKKNLFIYVLLFLLGGVATFTSCTVDEGTEPGNDSEPSILIYQYAASRPNNPDNDVVLRFATNSKTESAYYLVEPTETKEANVASMGEEGYKDYVVSEGIKIEGASGSTTVDVVVTDLYGEYTITAVAVSAKTKTSSEMTFTGLDWNDVVSGTYYFDLGKKFIGVESAATVLQVCTTNPDLYRFKDVFGEGYSMKINLIDYTGSDDNGTYRFFRIPAADTPFTYGNYGAISVRDIGYWQGNDAFVTNSGYQSGMYANYNCFLCISYYVSEGTLGYSNVGGVYDRFVVD